MSKEKENNGITRIRIVQEIYKKTCPECDKEITGVNKKQLIWNFNIHHESCKKKIEEEKQKQKEKKNETFRI